MSQSTYKDKRFVLAHTWPHFLELQQESALWWEHKRAQNHSPHGQEAQESEEETGVRQSLEGHEDVSLGSTISQEHHCGEPALNTWTGLLRDIQDPPCTNGFMGECIKSKPELFIAP